MNEERFERFDLFFECTKDMRAEPAKVRTHAAWLGVDKRTSLQMARVLGRSIPETAGALVALTRSDPSLSLSTSNCAGAGAARDGMRVVMVGLPPFRNNAFF